MRKLSEKNEEGTKTHRGAAEKLVSEETAKQVLQSMRDHARPHTPAPIRKHAAQCSQHTDHSSMPKALIRVSAGEHQSRQNNSSRNIPRQSHKLFLQISSVNSFLANTRR